MLVILTISVMSIITVMLTITILTIVMVWCLDLNKKTDVVTYFICETRSKFKGMYVLPEKVNYYIV